MGLLDKAKAAAEQAAAKAKEGVEDVQTKRDLGQAYGELGRKTYQLVSSGELSSSELEPIVEKIRMLEARTEEPAMAGTATTSADTPPSNQPPAMPT